MSSTTSLHRCAAALAATTLLMVIGMSAAPVSARHGEDHVNNGRSGEGGPNGGAAANQDAVTEDNDDNDANTPNNVPDDGDNAHPSGRDRSVEAGASGNQGASTSDPDGDSNGGADKPGGDGGTDLADQDANNGCGNDDDFEDDNNGNCGGRERARQRALAGAATTGTTGETGGAAVAGIAIDRAADATVGGDNAVSAPKIETSVLGISFERAGGASASVETPAASGASVLGTSFTRGGVLARTGAEILLIALTGLVMAVFGFGLTRFGRRSTT